MLAAPRLVMAQGGVVLGGVVLLQPEADIAPRVGSVAALADYINVLEQSLRNHYDAQPNAVRRSGFVVVAVKPRQQCNVWFDFTPELPAAEAGELSSRLRRLVPMPVSGGPVVFALQLGIAGGEPPKTPTPRPDEWAAEVAKAGRPIETGELVLRIWRE